MFDIELFLFLAIFYPIFWQKDNNFTFLYSNNKLHVVYKIWIWFYSCLFRGRPNYAPQIGILPSKLTDWNTLCKLIFAAEYVSPIKVWRLATDSLNNVVIHITNTCVHISLLMCNKHRNQWNLATSESRKTKKEQKQNKSKQAHLDRTPAWRTKKRNHTINLSG